MLKSVMQWTIGCICLLVAIDSSNAQNGQWLVSDSGTQSYRQLAYDPGSNPQNTAIGDFNGDEISDVFLVAPNGRWFVSDGGTKNYRPLAGDSRTLQELRLGDFNGDGITDVFAVGPNGQWFVSDGGVKGYRPLAADASRTIDDLGFGDFNGDDVTDVFVVDPATGKWFVSDSGTKSYRPLAQDQTRTIHDLRFGDMDGDGIDDVFAVDDSSGQWFYSKSGISNYAALAVGTALPNLTIVDFNGDGTDDVFAVINNQWYVSYGGVQSWVTLASDSRSIGDLKFGDFNGDKVTDVFAIGPIPTAVTIFFENFDELPLRPFQQEIVGGDGTDWTPTPPSGWSVDNSLLPNGGKIEWRGWTFADVGAWATTAEDQNRSQFTNARGAAAIADPDEWDDNSHDAGSFHSVLRTPPISLDGVKPGTVTMTFDSSWRPEASQKASLQVSFDGGPVQTMFIWDSDSNAPNFKGDATNETITIIPSNPAGASSMVFNFIMYDAGNNWWWAIDNISITAEKTVQPFDYNAAPGLPAPTAVDTPLRNGNALKLNGVDQFVLAQGAYPAFSQFSVEAWIKFTPDPNSTGKSYTILSKGDSNTGTIFSVYDDKHLWFYPGGVGATWVQSDATVPVNEWVHVAVLYDGTDAIFLVDGKWGGQKPATGSINQSAMLAIGNQYGVGANALVNMFPGEIDEVRLWNVVRPISEIMRTIDQPLPLRAINNGLAGYWPMNEGFGNSIGDPYTGVNGTLYNETNDSWPSSGISIYQGHAMNFDGVDDFIKVLNYPPNFTDISVEAWVKFQPTDPEKPAYNIFSKGPAGNATIFSIWSDHKLAFFTPGFNQWGMSDEEVPVDTWTHVAATFDGSIVRFYMNGKPVGTQSYSGVVDSGGNASIGNQDGDGSDNLTNLFSGRMDELRVWNDLRTAEEIQANMLNTVLYNDQGLVSYWKFDYLFSQAAIDQSQNVRDGVVQNSLGRVLSDFLNNVDSEGVIHNGVVTLSRLLSGAADAKYNNLTITGVPELGVLVLPGPVEVDVQNNVIVGGTGSLSLYGVTLYMHGASFQNGKLQLNVSIPELPLNPFIGWQSSIVGLLIDNNKIEIAEGVIVVSTQGFLGMETNRLEVTILPSQSLFGINAKLNIPGTLKNLVSPKYANGGFTLKNGKLDTMFLRGVNLGIPLGHEQIKLHTLGMAAENIQDIYNLKLTGDIKITGGPTLPLPNGTVFPLLVDTIGTITPSNGYIDITGKASLFSYEVGGAHVTFNPLDGSLNMYDAYIDMEIYKAIANVSIKASDGKISGGLEGQIKIPNTVPLVGGYSRTARAWVKGYDHFGGSTNVTLPAIPSVHIPQVCTNICGNKCLAGLCVNFCGCYTFPWPVGEVCLGDICFGPYDTPSTPSTTISVGFEFKGTNFTFNADAVVAKKEKPGLRWEIPYNQPYQTEEGTFQFMTNWDRAAKVDRSGVIRPFSVNPQGEPVSTFTIPEGEFDAIFRITYENPGATDVLASLTKPDGTVIDIHDGAFPDFFADESGFTRISPETREAYFYLFDPEPGDYTVTITDTAGLGEYSVEFLKEDIEPFIDLVAVYPSDEPNIFDILWFGSDDSEDYEIRLFLDRDREGLDGFEVTDLEYVEEDGETLISALVEDIPPGWYFPCLTIDDGKNAVVYDYANAPIFIHNINHPASILDFDVTPVDEGFAIEWTPLEEENLVSYTILYTAEDDTGSFEGFAVAGPSETSKVVKGLKNGVPLLVSIVASAQDGLQSPPENVIRVIPSPGPGKTPAIISSNPRTKATAGFSYVYLAKFYDGDLELFSQVEDTTGSSQTDATNLEPTYTWQLLDGPAGMTVDELSGFVFWIPSVAQIGIHKVALALFEKDPTDSLAEPNVSVQEFTVRVYPPDDTTGIEDQSPFQFLTQPALSAFRGMRYAYAPIMLHPAEYLLRWDLVQAPDGMDVDDNGILFWDVPEDAIGEYVSIEAVLDNGLDEVIFGQTFYLDVKDARPIPDTAVNEWPVLK